MKFLNGCSTQFFSRFTSRGHVTKILKFQDKNECSVFLHQKLTKMLTPAQFVKGLTTMKKKYGVIRF